MESRDEFKSIKEKVRIMDIRLKTHILAMSHNTPPDIRMEMEEFLGEEDSVFMERVVEFMVDSPALARLLKKALEWK